MTTDPVSHGAWTRRGFLQGSALLGLSTLVPRSALARDGKRARIVLVATSKPMGAARLCEGWVCACGQMEGGRLIVLSEGTCDPLPDRLLLSPRLLAQTEPARLAALIARTPAPAVLAAASGPQRRMTADEILRRLPALADRLDAGNAYLAEVAPDAGHGDGKVWILDG